MLSRFWRLLAVLAVGGTAACSNDAGSVAKGLTTRFVDSADARTATLEAGGKGNRSNSMGVVSNLGGSMETVRSQLGPSLIVLGRIPMPEAQAYVEAIRDRLLPQWPYPGTERPSVEITANTAYGAEALADNTIQLPLGVLQQARTEDEVAFVVGHELGHLLMRHQARRQDQLNRAETGVKVAGALAAVAAVKIRGTAGAVSQHTKEVIGGATLGGHMALAEVLTTLIDPGWSRRQEEQADLIGIDLMTAAGYNPQYAAQTFRALVAQEAEGARQQAGATREFNLQRDKSGKILAGESLVGFAGFALSPIGDRIRNLRVNHPDTQSRDTVTADYRDRFYEAKVTAPGRLEPLEQLRATRSFRNGSDAVAAMMQAGDALAARQFGVAVQDAMQARQLLPGWWAPPFVLGLIAVESGQGTAGLAQLDRSVTAGQAPYPVFERTAMEHFDSGDQPGAFRVLDIAARQFGGPDVTWLDRIALYSRMGDLPAAERVRATCLKSANIGLREQCGRTTFSSLMQ